MQEALLQRAIELRQKSEEVEQQLNFVTEQIVDLENFSKSLDEIENSKENEMLAPLGRGVYTKVLRQKDQKLFVEVGAGVLVRKTPREAQEIIDDQLKKFIEARLHLSAQLQDYASQFREMLMQVKALKSKNN